MNVRLITVLRLLRMALANASAAAGAAPWPLAWSFRVCLDDECHDTSEQPLPLFAMVACGGPRRAITLPLVQCQGTHLAPLVLHCWPTTGYPQAILAWRGAVGV